MSLRDFRVSLKALAGTGRKHGVYLAADERVHYGTALVKVLGVMPERLAIVNIGHRRVDRGVRSESATAAAATRGRSARTPLGVPATLAVGTARVVRGTGDCLGASAQVDVALPPVYRVHSVAAPRGARAIGVVTEAAPAPAAAPATPPKRAETITEEPAAPPKKKAPAKQAPRARATPAPDARSARRDEPAPKAGGGPEGGKGTDVANVDRPASSSRTRPISRTSSGRSRCGSSHRNAGAAPRRGRVPHPARRQRDRDPSAAAIRILRHSTSRRGERWKQAGKARAFGPLPDGCSDDVLTVIFTFDSNIIR